MPPASCGSDRGSGEAAWWRASSPAFSSPETAPRGRRIRSPDTRPRDPCQRAGMYRCTRPGTCLPPGRYSSCSRGRQPCAPTRVPACSISIGSWARGKGPGGPWDRLAVLDACAKPEHERTDAAALDELLCPESEGRYQSDANTSDDHGSWVSTRSSERTSRGARRKAPGVGRQAHCWPDSSHVPFLSPPSRGREAAAAYGGSGVPTATSWRDRCLTCSEELTSARSGCLRRTEEADPARPRGARPASPSPSLVGSPSRPASAPVGRDHGRL